MTTQTNDIIAQAVQAADTAVAAIQAATNAEELESLRVAHLGKKGSITILLRGMKDVPADQKGAVGQAVNAAKQRATEAIEQQKKSLASSGAPTAKNAIDVSMPGIRTLNGKRHPISSTIEEIKSIMIGLGFHYDDYPEIETEFNNFDGLNTPEWHPARDMHDTFYTESGRVMRTHTTAFQMHALRNYGTPPIRAITGGRCYRCDTIDASHYPVFHQIDAIAIDKNISFADLKWTLYELASSLFGDDIKLQFRPSFFPFTTPSAEVDVLFKGSWLEILGSGMMRPEVLQAGGLDPEQWQGFAFGIGADRVAMIRHGIDDIRHLYDNEEAFLRQF